MSAAILIIGALVISLQTVALIAASIGNLRSNARLRRLMASYDGALAAKDEELAAYRRLIAAQDALLEATRGRAA